MEISGTGTVVNATALEGGAGIGGGAAGKTGGAGSKVTITGGKVTVNSKDGAAIGGGIGVDIKGGAGGTVEISGTGTIVNATATGWGAVIGGGGSNSAGGDGGTVKISGTGTIVNVTVSGQQSTSGWGAGIGGGGSSTTGGDGGSVTITDGTVTANVKKGAGIGGGASNATGGNGANVKITGGTVMASSKDSAGIGGGYGSHTKAGDGGTVEISGVNTVVAAAATGFGAGIGGGGSTTKSGGDGANVTITDSTVTAKANNGTDIGGGGSLNTKTGDGGSLTIDSTGENRAVLELQSKGTNATPNHSIGTCRIKDAAGTLSGFYSKVTMTGGTAGSSDAQKDFWKAGIYKSGTTVKATANTPPQNQYFDGWTAAPALTFADPQAEDTTFSMPETAQAVTANFKQKAAPAIMGNKTMTLTYGYAATSSGAFTISGAPAPAVTIDKDYGGKITWNSADNKLDIAEGLRVGVYPVTLTASNGVDTDAVLTFTLTVSAPPTHEVIEGGNADVKPGKDYRVTFAGEYKYWKAIRLNGIEMGIIPQSDSLSYLTYPGYTGNAGQGEAGSVKITLYKEFLATLPAGVYKLEVEFEDGGVQTAGETEFKLLEESKPKPAPDTKPGTTKPANPSDVPPTGDTRQLWPWVLMLLTALLSGSTIVAYRKKKGQRQQK